MGKVWVLGITLGWLLSLVLVCVPKHASAVATARQASVTNVTNGGNSVAAAYGATATANDLLVVICGARDSSTLSISSPSGFNTVINEAGTPSQGIFYKVSAGTEGTITCSSTATTRLGIQIFEYSGVVTSSPSTQSNSATGNSGSVSSGSITTTNANSLILAGMTTQANTSFAGYTNSFTEINDFANGGAAGSRSTYASAFQSVSATGTYSTVATAGSGLWRGQIAAFTLTSPVLGVDIVDSGGATVGSPSISLSSLTAGFTCQTPTGTFGVSAQKIRISNFTVAPAWTLAIAATSGATTTWTTGSQTYDFNDSTGSGCTDGGDTDTKGGQMSLNASGGTSTAATGCTNTGISLGSNTSFVEGTTNSITLITGSASAALNCFWDLTTVAVSQKVPSDQPAGAYSLSLTLTVTAN